MPLSGSIFPLDDNGLPVDAEREPQQGFYYLEAEEVIETLPADEDTQSADESSTIQTDPVDAEPLKITWDEPDYPYVIVDLTVEQAQNGLPFRAQWRQDRDPSGRTWGWELIE